MSMSYSPSDLSPAENIRIFLQRSLLMVLIALGFCTIPLLAIVFPVEGLIGTAIAVVVVGIVVGIRQLRKAMNNLTLTFQDGREKYDMKMAELESAIDSQKEIEKEIQKMRRDVEQQLLEMRSLYEKSLADKNAAMADIGTNMAHIEAVLSKLTPSQESRSWSEIATEKDIPIAAPHPAPTSLVKLHRQGPKLDPWESNWDELYSWGEPHSWEQLADLLRVRTDLWMKSGFLYSRRRPKDRRVRRTIDEVQALLHQMRNERHIPEELIRLFFYLDRLTT